MRHPFIRTYLAVAVILAVLVVAWLPATAGQASLAERQRIAHDVASEIHANPSTFHHLKGVEIGAAVVNGYNALADWRSTDGMQHGQVALFIACDHWNVSSVSFGRNLTPREIQSGDHPFGKPDGRAQLAELAALEAKNTAYLRPATGSTRC